MRVLISGADGFIGKNLRQHLAELQDIQVVCFCRQDSPTSLPELLAGVNFVFHLAGVNRPIDPQDFEQVNQGLTQVLCCALAAIAKATGRKIPVAYTSSTQADLDNAYGVSKKGAEDALFDLQRVHNIPVYVFRLPNVFGKWAKPQYNSAVATFCYNITRGLPIVVNDPVAPLQLLYVDDLVETFLALLRAHDAALPSNRNSTFAHAGPVYETTVGAIVHLLQSFSDSRRSLEMPSVGVGLVRALYCTYVSYLPAESFSYELPSYEDSRGVFVEILKTPDCGQFSYFTAHPGITRGGHYHHSKTEKFLVIKGQARFRFKHLPSGQLHELVTDGNRPEIVETVPGWSHDITNIGHDEMIVMVWANEVFERARPDTFAHPLLGLIATDFNSHEKT